MTAKPPPPPLERIVLNHILVYLRAQGAFAEKIHGDGLQTALLDIVACYRGQFIALEVKRSEKYKATPRQEFIIQKVKDAQGISATVHSVEEVAQILREIDRV